MARKILLSWSSGKDSAWSLHVLGQTGHYEIVGLLTTFNGLVARVAMHGVRRALAEAQTQAAGVRLWDVDLPWPCSNDYECAMGTFARKAIEQGIEGIAFGDYLVDVRECREKHIRVRGLNRCLPFEARPRENWRWPWSIMVCALSWPVSIPGS